MKTTRGYEDNYSGTEYESGANLLADLETCATGPFADLNVPVWISVSDEDSDDSGIIPARLEVATFMPRHGGCHIRYTDRFTAEDVDAIRRLFMMVWAGRADAGFDRHPSLVRPIGAAR